MPRVLRSRGLLAMLATGALWGTVFVGPELVPDTPATLLVGGRYLLFGLVAGLTARHHLRGADWWRAARYAIAGFLGYYLLLVLAVQRAGAAPVTVVVGVTPVVYAIVGARRDRLDLRRLAGPLAVLIAGIVLVNVVDITSTGGASPADLAVGLVLAAASVAVWIWYGFDNGHWVRETSWTSRAWTGVVGVATGVLAVPMLAHGLFVAGGEVTPRLVVVWVALGVGPAWLGTMTWNTASRLLPDTVTGPLLVTETLAALTYTHVLHGTLPNPFTATGYVFLAVGVVFSYAAVTTSGRVSPFPVLRRPGRPAAADRPAAPEACASADTRA